MLEFQFYLAKVILNNRMNSNYCDNYLHTIIFEIKILILPKLKQKIIMG